MCKRLFWLFLLGAATFVPHCLADEMMSHQGLMTIVRKGTFARDMAHVVRSILENARIWDYPDIKVEERGDFYRRRLFITDILVSGFNFCDASLLHSLVFDPQSKTVTLSSQDPAIEYNFTFRWRAEMMGAHLAAGTGNASMISRRVTAVYSIRKSEPSRLDTEFDVQISGVGGETRLLPGVRDWLLRKMRESTYNTLRKAIACNARRFLEEHVQRPMLRLTKRPTGVDTIDYIGQPTDAAEVGDYLMYAFRVTLQLNGKKVDAVSRPEWVPISPITHDLAVYISAVLAPMTLNIHGLIGKYDGEFDTRLLGLTGTVKDLFTAIPDLRQRYTGDESLLTFCEYAHDGVMLLPLNAMEFRVRCNFSVAAVLLLSAKVELNARYDSTVAAKEKRLFAITMKEVTPIRHWMAPESPEVETFVKKLFKDFVTMKYEGKQVAAPMIRYEPYRDFSRVAAEVRNGSYVASYDDDAE